MSRREPTGPACPVFHAGELAAEVWLKWTCAGGNLVLCSSLARLLHFRYHLDKHLGLHFLFQLNLGITQCLPGQCSSLPRKFLLSASGRKRHSGLEGSGVCLHSGRGQQNKRTMLLGLACCIQDSCCPGAHQGTSPWKVLLLLSVTDTHLRFRWFPSIEVMFTQSNDVQSSPL